MFSTAITSLISWTIHKISLSLLVLEHISQIVESDKLLQLLQNFIFSLKLINEFANWLVEDFGSFKTCNANLKAVLLPIPGSCAMSSTAFWSNFDENSLIIETFTFDHGKYSGIVYGGSSKKKKKIFQIGNKILLNWKSKSENKINIS